MSPLLVRAILHGTSRLPWTILTTTYAKCIAVNGVTPKLWRNGYTVPAFMTHWIFQEVLHEFSSSLSPMTRSQMSFTMLFCQMTRSEEHTSELQSPVQLE